MENNSLISVIVPVYQANKYIDRCVSSILDQTYKNLEIILIDDGSDDGSETACDKWSEIDSRVKVVHKQNEGASAARNVGIRKSTGLYIGFVDSDDYIHPDMYEYLMDLINKHDAEMVMCDYASSMKEKNKKEKIEICNRDDMFKKFFRVNGEKDNHNIWTKLIKRNLIEKFEFKKGYMNEDILANFDWICNVNKAAVSNRKLYFYQYNKNGETNSPISMKNADLLKIWDIIIQKVESGFPNYIFYAKINRARAAFTLLAQMFLHGYNKYDENVVLLKKKLYKETKINYINLIKWNMPLSRKVLLTFLLLINGVKNE